MKKLLALSCAALVFSAPTHAGGLFEISEDNADTFLDLGIAAISRPEYLGSDENGVLVVPYFNAEYEGRYYLNPYQGVGINFINQDKFELSGGLTYLFGRDGEDTPFTLTPMQQGAFDLDGSVGARVSASATFKYARADLSVTQPLGGDVEGPAVNAILATMIPTGNDRLRIFPSVNMYWSSQDRNNNFYGISQQQSAQSGLTGITFDSGISSYGANVAGFFTLTEKVELVGVLSYAKLAGDLKDSPFAVKDDGVTAAIALAYKYK
ncbi:MipA/OmpV family protein [Robiginitomaculum antarcticum]|uniref:MipA/OmpV family protein n=1 Tax=Robiginitomaculum antarcticum TaxID=437507 RepID=UPI00036EC1D6|nr:MipA/OmpV family protein [Robiginitomaculum antarcticum]